VTQPFGVVHVLIAGETAEERPIEQIGLAPGVGTGVVGIRNRHGQAQANHLVVVAHVSQPPQTTWTKRTGPANRENTISACSVAVKPITIAFLCCSYFLLMGFEYFDTSSKILGKQGFIEGFSI
jgi:hypothetical protein